MVDKHTTPQDIKLKCTNCTIDVLHVCQFDKTLAQRLESFAEEIEVFAGYLNWTENHITSDLFDVAWEMRKTASKERALKGE
jgi:hypothetical protein